MDARDAMPAVNTVTPAIEPFEAAEAKAGLIAPVEKYGVDLSS
jgi:hypothetical protein